MTSTLDTNCSETFGIDEFGRKYVIVQKIEASGKILEPTTYIIVSGIRYLLYKQWLQYDKYAEKLCEDGTIMVAEKWYENVSGKFYHSFVSQNHVHYGTNTRLGHDFFNIKTDNVGDRYDSDTLEFFYELQKKVLKNVYEGKGVIKLN
jgi:hypothetical protein